MSMFEYVIILISIVIGLALTHLMQGIAGIIQHPKRTRIWWVHLVWVAYMFVQTLFWWWWEFRLQRIEVWTFSTYAFVISYAFIIYLICALLFPRDLEGYEGYQDYFLSRRRWFFGLLIFTNGVDLVDTWLKGADYFASLGPEYVIATVPLVLLALVLMFTERASIHGAIAVIFLTYQVSWVLRLFNTIS